MLRSFGNVITKAWQVLPHVGNLLLPDYCYPRFCKIGLACRIGINLGLLAVNVGYATLQRISAIHRPIPNQAYNHQNRRDDPFTTIARGLNPTYATYHVLSMSKIICLNAIHMVYHMA